MPNPYRVLLLSLLPAVGCPLPSEETGKPDDTADTAGTESERGCYTLAKGEKTCPDPADVAPDDLIPQTCGAEVVSVDGEGKLGGCGWIGGVKSTQWCIYPITVIPPEKECDYGRPLVMDGAPRLAPLVGRRDWSTGGSALLDRPARAAAWARVGLAEHASVASFARFTLSLLAVGAPAELVAAAQVAAADEVRHAQLAFGLARRLGGLDVGPGPLALADLAVDTDLASLAVAAVREGCIAETLSALQVAAARDASEDEGERAVLAVLARDEERHAALAWRFVRWAIAAGGEQVRAAVEAAFTRGPGPAADADGDEGRLLPAAVAHVVVQRGWTEVILPAAAALLAQADAHLSA